LWSIPLDKSQLEERDWIDNLESLSLRNPDTFVAGQIHSQKENWKTITGLVNNTKSELVLDWIENGVDATKYFQHFKGQFKGKHYDTKSPPITYFKNHSSCQNFKSEISQQITDRLKSGSLKLLGKVGEVEPPHLVMPLVMVPQTNKNRLCHDERFLNLFVKSEQFHLETLSTIQNVTKQGDFMASTDEKSAYDGISLSENSYTYFGIEWCGWYMVHTTLPFGFKLSPYCFQTIGMQATEYLRMQNIITTQYLDDRFIGPSDIVHTTTRKHSTGNSLVVSSAILTALGYTFGLVKSIWEPTCTMKHLGFIMHSEEMHFSIPQAKIDSFNVIRSQLLSQKVVHLKLLQRFMGKCISFQICIPGTKIFIREMAAAISNAQKSSKPIPIENKLREEIEAWDFISQPRVQYIPWKNEKHVSITLSTDASKFAWGGVVGNMVISDMWKNDDSRPIHLKEAEALEKTLSLIPQKIKNKRVDAYVDNMALLKAWEHGGAKDICLNRILKRIFEITMKCNCELRLLYVSSENNPADTPSRRLSKNDTMLGQSAWQELEKKFGPHTFDLMSVDSNTQKDKLGKPLPHYTPFPLPGSSGVNCLAQTLKPTENYYCFPPHALISPLLKFLVQESTRPLHLTLVVPRPSPLPAWWPILCTVSSPTLLASKGESAISTPTRQGYVPHPLEYPLYTARINLD
jgi:hypothetical protein